MKVPVRRSELLSSLPTFLHGHQVIVDSFWVPIKDFSLATCCGITMTSCKLRLWLRARHSNSLGLPPSPAFKLFLRFYVGSEQVFAYVLSSVLNGELIFAVLEVFFPGPTLYSPRSIGWRLFFFSPLLSSCPPIWPQVLPSHHL